MRVTSKGQVTIPRNIRETLGITAESDIEFFEENGKFYITKTDKPSFQGKINKLRGIATAGMTTDEIMNLTREL